LVYKCSERACNASRKRLAERADKEKKFKEKDLMQKQMDAMRADSELEPGKAHVGGIVQVSQIPLLPPPARYACFCWIPLLISFNLYVCVIYLINFSVEAEHESGNCAGGLSC
jgi:hypothetical protein